MCNGLNFNNCASVPSNFFPRDSLGCNAQDVADCPRERAELVEQRRAAGELECMRDTSSGDSVFCDEVRAFYGCSAQHIADCERERAADTGLYANAVVGEDANGLPA